MSALAALEAWTAARDAAMIPAAMAGYRPGGDPLKTCRLCGYHDGARCLIVAGITSDAGTCDLWKPKDTPLD